MTARLSLDLIETGRRVAAAIDRPTPAQEKLIDEVHALCARIEDDVFRIAVLGQFKRGKSTLLNALIGLPLLRTGVVPMTAVPTFLSADTRPRITLHFRSGEREERICDTTESLIEQVAIVTTEKESPDETWKVVRVEIGLPGPGWFEEFVLVDTPGIGSTRDHNTSSTLAVLSDCDAALLVLSADPPITAAESQFLTMVCRAIPRVLIVLNKIDLLDRPDRHEAETFLASVLADRSEPQIDRKFFSLSARSALAARLSGDEAALEASGLPSLERYMRTSLAARKRRLLETSVAGKIAAAVDNLLAETAMTAKALSLPLGELDERIARFEAAMCDIERERTSLTDSVGGEWRRACERLETLCRDLDRQIIERVEKMVEAAGDAVSSMTERATLAAAMNEAFDHEYASLVGRFHGDLQQALDNHRRRYEGFAERVREAAGSLFDLQLPAPVPTDWFQITRQPYWVAEYRVESLSSLTIDTLAALLPKAWRKRRERRLLRDAVERAITRNISDLQWTMRQNVDDSFRHLLSTATSAIDTGMASVREVLATARGRRLETGDALRDDIGRTARSLDHLISIRNDLTGLLRNETPRG